MLSVNIWISESESKDASKFSCKGWYTPTRQMAGLIDASGPERSIMKATTQSQWWPDGSKCYCRMFHLVRKIRWNQADLWCKPMYFAHKIFLQKNRGRTRRNGTKFQRFSHLPFSPKCLLLMPVLQAVLSVPALAVSRVSFNFSLPPAINVQNCHQPKSAQTPWALHIPSFWIVAEWRVKVTLLHKRLYQGFMLSWSQGHQLPHLIPFQWVGGIHLASVSVQNTFRLQIIGVFRCLNWDGMIYRLKFLPGEPWVTCINSCALRLWIWPE